MHSKKTKSRIDPKRIRCDPPQPSRRIEHLCYFLLIAFIALFTAVETYGPSLHSPFVFDDLALPFIQPEALDQPLSYWLGGVRPVLMFSYFLNRTFSGLDTFPYHFVNVLIHSANACLVFALVFRLLSLAGCSGHKRIVLTSFAMAVFLLHPLQTECVSYVAGRSESLASFFFLCAWCIFVYWRCQQWVTAAIAFLFLGLAAGTKENMTAAPLVLLLTDFYWSRCPLSISGWRENWRLYTLLLAGAPLAVYGVWRVLSTAGSAGFHTRDFTPFSYFFTQTRVLWNYIRLSLLPVGQSIDHDMAVSHNLFEHWAWLALALWLIGFVGAWVLRRSYRLASFGMFVFFFLLAPTSSFIPIADAFVERRMYLPMVGLLLIACELLRAADVGRPAILITMGATVLALSAATYSRNQLWTDPINLWFDAVNQAPLKDRVYENLAYVAIPSRRCGQALPWFAGAHSEMVNHSGFLIAWGRVLECAGDRTGAMHKLYLAQSLNPDSYVYELEGLLYGEMGQMDKAKVALDKAIDLVSTAKHPDEAFEDRGYWYEVMHNPVEAMNDYARAVALNKSNFSARIRLRRLQNNLQEADRRQILRQ